jgi:metal-responsive CopG/Arc/MetJ family transcriptional regulator
MQKLSTMSKFSVSLPVELHRAFKVRCAEKGARMSEVIRMLVERELGTAEKSKPDRRGRRLSEQPAV